jgi:dihydrofolate synthase/folylpolyglutamate synthase
MAQSRQAPLTVVGRTEIEAAGKFQLSLAGQHQKTNAALAVAVARVLNSAIPLPASAIEDGLKTTEWAGRLQTIKRSGGQTVLLDGAHNPAGAQTLAAALAERCRGPRPAMILGTMRDKDYTAICEILAPRAGKIFLSQMDSERGADPQVLAALCREANPAAPAVVCGSVEEALQRAASEPVVVITGSIHFVGAAMETLGLAPRSPERALNEYFPVK